MKNILHRTIARHAVLPALIFLLISMAAEVLPADSARGTSIVDTPHNLSAVSGGKGAHAIKSATEERICIFCHTPHHSTAVTPLWSRDLSDQSYTMYESKSFVTPVLLRSDSSSRLCLSCHDGTIALGHLSGGKDLDTSLKSFNEIPSITGETNPRKNPNLGVNLSNDHPFAFAYTWKAELEFPANLKGKGTKLEEDTYVECVSCHNPHNNQFGNFLVVNSDLQHDALCTICHLKTGWNDANTDNGHRSGGSRAGYSQILRDAVKADGCISCHLPHGAPGPEYLQTAAKDADTCYACHANPPYTDIRAEFNQMYHHKIESYDKLHTPVETLPVPASEKHVECDDCHNPHQAGWQDAPLDSLKIPIIPPDQKPFISGPLRGVRKDIGGGTASKEYEICFKCHAGDNATAFTDDTLMLPARQFFSMNEADRFSTANPSYHPVMGDRPLSSTGRSLKVLYQDSMKRIFCIDCHSPHGALERHILLDRNEESLRPHTSYSDSDFQLCFRCHDSSFLYTLSPSATLHVKHVQGTYGIGAGKNVPCRSCHDPHGVPATGAQFAGGAHLVNFDTTYTGLNPVYSPTARSCSVAGACHTLVAPFQMY